MTIRKPYIVVGVVVVLAALEVVLYSLFSPGTHVISPVTAIPTTTQSAPSTPAVTSVASSSSDLGTYAYECDEHVNLTLTPSNDMATIVVKPTSGNYPATSTLARETAQGAVLYEGNGVVLTAHGETVTLDGGDSTINCSPVQIPDMAPFNFGD